MSDKKVLEEVISKAGMCRVNTTLGELICAISEAAEEAAIDEKNLAAVTSMILNGLLDPRSKLN